MIVLASTSGVLRARLSAAPAATNPTFLFSYGDEPVSGQATGVSHGALNGTTNVSLVGSPASGKSRVIKSGFIYNGDSASVTITIEHYDGTTARAILKTTLAAGATLTFSDVGWAGGSVNALPFDWIIALGDETTAITTGTAKVTIRAPRAFTLTKVKASLSTASSSGAPAFDMKVNGTSVFSTALTIDATKKTSEGATTPAVLSKTAIAADDEITFDITAAGTGAAGAKIALVGSA